VRPVVSLLILIAAGCGPSTSDVAGVKIIGGVPIADHVVPEVVPVMNEGGSLCTGTFVSPTVVFTAAHCLTDLSARVFVLHNGRRETAFRVIKHPDFINPDLTALRGSAAHRRLWQKNAPMDLAVLVFGRPISDRYLSVSKPSTGSPRPRRDSVTLVGYGTPTFNLGGEYMKRSGTNVLTRELANGVFTIRETESRILTSTIGTQSVGSHGDSGGPMIWNGKIAAVTSWGFLTVDSVGVRQLTVQYASLNSNVGKAFIESVSEQGVDIR